MIIEQEYIVRLFDPNQQPMFEDFLNQSCHLTIPLLSIDFCNQYLEWATQQTETKAQRNNYYKYTTVKTRHTRLQRPSIFTVHPPVVPQLFTCTDTVCPFATHYEWKLRRHMKKHHDK